MRITFVKMHGLGNDFVVLNGLKLKLPKDLSDLAGKLCDRRFGIGADQLLVLRASTVADFRMDIFNADGSEVEMCGNGIRCLSKFVRDLQLSTKTTLAIETLSGIVRPEVMGNHPQNTANTLWVRVDMGEPVLEGSRIPVRQTGQVIAVEKKFGGKTFKITCLSMGNPHCVVFVDDVESCPVQSLGSVIEGDDFFPERVNVEFVQVVGRKNLRQRTWERGVGETLACGSGASAVCVAAVLNKLTDRDVVVSLKGGTLSLIWDEKTNHVFKTGPATTSFSGVIDYDL